jgi:RNA polymerase sigma-70 factor (ECF subfamily)
MTPKPDPGGPDPGARRARAAAERAARDSFGRLVAFVAPRAGDLAAAEDAVAEAFRAALETWPRRGIPDRPEAWLLTAARRAAGHARRRAGTAGRALPDLARALDEAEEAAMQPASPFPDNRLRLLFACAHPAVDEAARTPLMLQAVLGLPAHRIASAFLTAPAAMSQRLVRAKAKVSAMGFPEPAPEDVAARLPDVMDAVHAAFGAGWDDGPGSEAARDLAAEAIWLAEALCLLLPGESEPKGLLAAMLYAAARTAARRDANGAYVPLGEQDTALWDRAMIARADALLAGAGHWAGNGATLGAGRAGAFGRFRCEAAIQAVHAERAHTGRTNHDALAVLYEALARLRPTVGVLVARAAAAAAAGNPALALDRLDALAGAADGYQPYWAVRAHALAALGRPEAAAAYTRAIGLASDPALCAWLSARAAQASQRS